MLGGWWGLWRENWLYLWITATAREVVQCCGGGVWSACEGFGGGVWGLMAVLWADAVKIGKMLSASSPTSQELFGVVACC